jgi:ribose 5-phosphate isomerase
VKYVKAGGAASMFEKIVLAVAIACSLYLNIQVKAPQKVAEVGFFYPVAIASEDRLVVMPRV